MSEPDDNGSGGGSRVVSSTGGGGGAGGGSVKLPLDRKPADLSLPSEHIAHANMLSNEMNIRLTQFNTGISALEGERDGQIETFEREEAERKEKHLSLIASLDRRIEDLKKGKRMLEVALSEGERK